MQLEEGVAATIVLRVVLLELVGEVLVVTSRTTAWPPLVALAAEMEVGAHVGHKA
jgi:hypothetical protein